MPSRVVDCRRGADAKTQGLGQVGGDADEEGAIAAGLVRRLDFQGGASANKAGAVAAFIVEVFVILLC
ncbi:hypothetical protein CCR95_02365 [Thiocystis minor]|nr:hypothetical protein [Thiocystis minor]